MFRIFAIFTLLAGGGYIPYNGNYQKDLDVMDEIEELLEPDEDAPTSNG